MNSMELQAAYCPQLAQESQPNHSENFGNGGMAFDTDYGQDFSDFTRAHDTRTVRTVGFVGTTQVEVE